MAARSGPRPRPRATSRRRAGRVGRTAALVAALLCVAACGGLLPTTTPVPVAVTATPTASPSPTPAATPTTPPVPTLTVAIDGDLAGGLSNAATGADAVRFAGFIHDGLYGLDAGLRPVPRLAAGPPSVSGDGRTWTVPLRAGLRFADGSPLTAADVVRVYELARSPRCPYRPEICLDGVLQRVTALDDQTIAFTLAEPLSAFGTTGLGIGIESAAAMDAAFAAFSAGFGDVTAAETAGYLGLVTAEEARPTGPAGTDGKPTIDAASLRGPGEALLTRAGVALPAEADHQVAGGGVDAVGYVDAIAARVRAIDATFTSRPIDALAAAYPFLATADAPVTSGPFQLAPADVAAGVDGAAVVLIANPAYPGGPPAIERIVGRVVGSDAAAAAGLADGSVDWRPGLDPAGYAAVRDDPSVQVAQYPEFGFTGLTFNLHPQAKGLFLDRNLRQAVALCFDHGAAVTAAVGEDGVAIDTEIPAMSWAYPTSGLATYPLDRARAKRLIEASGWSLGADGIYAKAGRRLSTVVPVREGHPERTRWLEAVRRSVRACGIDLQVAEVPFAAILKMLAVYPHINAAASLTGARADARPFDAYFGGLETGLDPDPFRLYHSSQCTSADQPDTYNFGCYQDPAVDKLIEAARRAPDLTVRARLYQDYAARLSTDLPVIYAWSDLVREGIAGSVGTTAPGGLALDTPTWDQPIDDLTNVR